MKRYVALIICLLLLIPTLVHADIIPKDMKPIYVSAYLDNLDEYPEYVFVKLETLGDAIRDVDIIKPGKGFDKGYKLNRMRLLAVPRGTYEAVGGDLSKLDLLGDTVILRHDGTIESGQQLVPRPSSLAGMEVHYRVSINQGQLSLEEADRREFKEHPNSVPINLMFYGFIVTFAVEFIVFLLLMRFVFRSREPKALRALLVVCGAQAATLPLLWFIINHYSLMGTVVMLAAESFAVGVEAVIYRFFARLTWQRALLASALCNVASYVVGMMA